AGRILLLAAEEALAAGDHERNHHLLPDPQAGVSAPHLDHLAHELVAEDVAAVHAGDDAVIEVEIRAADGGGGDPDDGGAGIGGLATGNRVHPDSGFAVPGQCAHEIRP